MTIHLQRDLDELSRQLLTMGALVEVATNKGISAAMRRDAALAREVISGDRTINEMENQIEENALKILALHQPVAQDLRFIITALKVNNDLERMGDLAANVSERAATLAEFDPLETPASFRELVTSVQAMVRDSLNALVERDAATARRVCQVDDRVDEINREMFHYFQAFIRKHPEMCEPALSTISVSRHLERIADIATNIAEDVIFMVEGEIVRHRL